MAYIDTPGDIHKVTMAFVFPNEQVQEAGIQFAMTLTGGSDSRPAFAGTIDSLVQAHILAYLSDSVRYYGCRVSSARGRMPWASVYTKQVVMGAMASPALPTQARVTTKWYTNFVGRAYRGRTYWPTPAAAAQDASGTPGTGYCTAIAIIADTLVASMIVGGTTWTPCIHHKVAKGDPPEPYHIVTAERTIQKWSTQRRSGDLGTANGLPW